MPYLRFKGFEEEFLQQNRSLIVAEFSRISGVPPEIVKIELLAIEIITDTPRSVEIFMFPRDQQRHDRIAENLYDLLTHFGYPDVHIFFVLLTPSLYYKGGTPLNVKEISWLTWATGTTNMPYNKES